MRNIIEWKFADGRPIDVGATTNAYTSGYRLIPRSFVLTLRWPGGGYVYNKPVGITVEQGEKSRYATIPDPTRTAQWVFALLYALVFLWLIRSRFFS